MRRIVVVLAVQWGYPGDKVARWFKINPYNHSGRRLIDLIGHDDFTVTNACSQIVYRATDQGVPDRDWLRRNLKALRPQIVLVCGKVAQQTFEDDMAPRAKVLYMQHPAARMWTRAMLRSMRNTLRKAQTV